MQVTISQTEGKEGIRRGAARENGWEQSQLALRVSGGSTQHQLSLALSAQQADTGLRDMVMRYQPRRTGKSRETLYCWRGHWQRREQEATWKTAKENN